MEENESNSTFKSVNGSKNKLSFSKSVLMPFMSGVVGASLVIGTCFGIPEIKEKIFTQEVNESQVSTENYTKPTTNQVNATAVSLKEYSDTAIGVAEKVLPSICRDRNRV